MKRCPQCGNKYNDELSICIVDRAPLISDPPTPQEQQATTFNLSELPTISNIQVCPNERLHDIAEYGIKRLQKFVLVESCTVESSELTEGYIDFIFSILNLSLYSVSIPVLTGTIIEGSILFKGKMLSGGAKLVENSARNISPTGQGSFKIRQWVNQKEANDISETLKKSGNLFDFSNTVVNIRNDDFPEAQAVRLDLTRVMLRAGLENKIVELENENSWLSKGLDLWWERTDKVIELTRTLGMFYLAYNQSEQGELLTQETGKNLRGRFARALHHCFHDDKIVDDYLDNSAKFPDSVYEQRTWIDSQCSKLRALIDEQSEEVKEFINNPMSKLSE